jgi:hypothetical protein
LEETTKQMNIIKKHKELTIEEIKTVKGYDDLTDEEALQVMRSLEIFSIITFYLYQNLQNENEQDQHLYKQAA